MPYWTCARVRPQHERLALHCLELAGYETYLPRLRERRVSHGRKIEIRPPLFPGYAFVAIELQWHAARWSVGVLGLIMDGERPARVPDAVITNIKAREVRGLVELSSKPRLRRGEPVRILQGPFRGCLALYAGQAPHERVAVLLTLLGGRQRVTLSSGSIELAPDSGGP
jgi:transcriptional antiterminator RfaH